MTSRSSERPTVVCPVGHSRSFTQYGIGLYVCDDCGSGHMEYMFTRENGKPVWIEPEKVPIGLREMLRGSHDR
jgi:hypothetical protein